jgi:hypothetical protein
VEKKRNCRIWTNRSAHGFIIRFALAVLAVLACWYVEETTFQALFLLPLLSVSSIVLSLAALFLTILIPWRCQAMLPAFDTLIQFSETGCYPLPLLLCIPAALLAATGRLVAQELKNPAAGNIRFTSVYWLQRLCLAGMIFSAINIFFRFLPVPVMAGWTFLTGIYVIALSRSAEIRLFPGCRKVLGTGLYVLYTLGVVVILLEGWGWFFPVQPGVKGSIYEPNHKYLFAMCPGGTGMHQIPDNDSALFEIPFKISSQGWRDREFGPKRENEFRILMLGDSFTMGHATTWETSIPQQLERLLTRADIPEKVTVINCGVGGSGPWQQRGYLLERGFILEPDLVIHQLFPSNDIENSLIPVNKRQRAYDANWQLILKYYRRWDRLDQRAERWFRRHSFIYSTLVSGADEEWVSFFISNSRFYEKRHEPVPAMVTAQEDRDFLLECHLTDWYPELQEGFERMQADVRGIFEDCISRGVDYAVWNQPISTDMDRERFEQYQKDHDNIYTWRKPLLETEKFLHKSDIPCFRVIEHMEMAGPVERLYFLNDGHLTARGCKAVARAIRDWLETEYFPERFP